MKDKIQDFFESNLFIFIIAIFIGIACHQAVTFELLASDEKIAGPNKLYATPSPDENLFPRPSIFKNFINTTQREDENYKYVDIITEDNNSDELKIDIKDGMINITSETKKSTSVKNERSSVFSAFSSSFNQSFNVPEGVNEKKVEIIKGTDQKPQKIIIKFPKTKGNMI